MSLHYNTVKPELLTLIKMICGDPFFNGYRLVGGTSLSLQIGHRGSIDADFFSDGNGQPVPQLLKYVFPKIISNMAKVEQEHGCMGVTAGGVKLDVFDYGDPFVMPARNIDGIRLASLLDIGLMKLEVQKRRNGWKDLIDLNAITEIHPLAELLSIYNRRYPPLPVKQSFMALVKNLNGPPPTNQFPHDLMFNKSNPGDIISNRKKKSLEVYKSILQQQTKILNEEKAQSNIISKKDDDNDEEVIRSKGISR